MRTDRMAHHEFTMSGKMGDYNLSVADVGDNYYNVSGPAAEAAVCIPDQEWDIVWRGPHAEALGVFILLKEALKAKIHPDRWISVQGGRLLHE